MQPLAVLATGMMTGVGLDAPSSCAAVRCAIERFEETRFIDLGGAWIVGSEVPLEPPSRGREKLLRMAISVINECLAGVPEISTNGIAMCVCLAESDRPGRLGGLDETFLGDIQQQSGVQFHPSSAVICEGRIGGARSMIHARELIDQGCTAVLIVGVDSFLVGPTLASFENRQRLLTSQNSNGFVPGEAAAALLMGDAATHADAEFVCLGAGRGQENATIDSEEPLRGDGLAAAFRDSLANAECTFDDVDYRLTDCNGEQYSFKEAALAMARAVRVRKPEFDIWHTADCIGEVGAASVPCAIAVAAAAADKGYAPGRGVLAHFGNDDGARVAMVFDHRLKEESTNGQ